MDSGQIRGTGGQLARAEVRFDRWRRGRKRRGPIPDELWKMAGEAALVHGVHVTARRLRLNATSLKQQMERLGQSRGSDKPACFVQLPLVGPVSVPECILEAEGRDGIKLRIHLKAAATAHAVALGGLLWKGEP
jgi:hypothetical protein